MNSSVMKFVGLYINVLNRVSPKTGAAIGFKQFCKPMRSKLKKQHHDFFDKSSQQDYDFNGINIKIYEWGHGPKKVLFVHGWQSHSYKWKKYIELLPESEYTLIAFDAPGHGLSSGDQFHVPLNAFLIFNLTKKYNGFDTVVAHSIGSMSVLYALSFYGITTVKSFIAMATPGKAGDFFEYYTQALQLNERTIQNVTNVFQRNFRQDMDYFSAASFAENCNIRGLIIHDSNDVVSPYKNALELSKSWKNGHLITTKGLGHNLNSGEVMETVVQYINTGKTDFKL